jgi:Tfp pilus assembly protein PilO
MDKATRDKLILAVLGLLLVGLIAYYGVPPLGLPSLGAVRSEVEKLRGERNALAASVQNAKLQVVALDKIKKEREVLEAQLKELSARLPSERETPALLRKVEELTLKSGLQLAEIRRRPIRAQELYAEIPMEVGVGGSYGELLKFAKDLGDQDRLVALSEVGVARGRLEGANAGSVVAKLVAVVFQTLPEAPPAPPAR